MSFQVVNLFLGNSEYVAFEHVLTILAGAGGRQ